MKKVWAVTTTTGVHITNSYHAKRIMTMFRKDVHRTMIICIFDIAGRHIPLEPENILSCRKVIENG